MSNVVGLLTNKILWAVLAFGALWGAYKYEGWKVKKAQAELVQAIESKGKVVQSLDDAARLNKTLKLSLEMQAEDAEVQARAADQARAKERLAWQRLNKLQKEIGNVPTTENVPVSQHLELLFDELRSAVPGDARPADDNVGGSEEPSGPLGPVVPTDAAPTS